MGKKINPIVFRLGLYNNWKSRWFAKGSDFARFLLEDYNIREAIKSKMGPQAAISEIIIERGIGRLDITIFTARPGVLIGRGGKQLETLREELVKMIGKKFKLEIVEVKKADLNASVVAQTIGMQISKRMPFRRAVKQALQRSVDAGAKGVMIRVAGRLDGAEISRSESYKNGSIPLSTLRADIDFAAYGAKTTFGIIGIKVWINLGEKAK
ncbi:MAG: 30S ribosomal protein S3 [Candidatus Berkelbacteria bacterium]|nr:30S ribosomal protein S3 [Candidatus Berkelbacteria bacterium]